MRMMKHIRKYCGFILDRKGFTLIEMAIVLIIIGIIIGAVIKGKDVVKSAEQKKLYTQFLREWQVAFNSYYDRSGLILADQTNATNDAGGVRNGQCDDSDHGSQSQCPVDECWTESSCGRTDGFDDRSYVYGFNRCFTDPDASIRL